MKAICFFIIVAEFFIGAVDACHHIYQVEKKKQQKTA